MMNSFGGNPLRNNGAHHTPFTFYPFGVLSGQVPVDTKIKRLGIQSCAECGTMYDSGFAPTQDNCGHLKCKHCMIRTCRENVCRQCTAVSMVSPPKLVPPPHITQQIVSEPGSPVVHAPAQARIPGEEPKEKIFLAKNVIILTEVTDKGPLTLFKCVECKKKFYTKGHAKFHEECQSTEFLPYKCGQCAKGFTTLLHYNHHLRLHSGERRFKCTTCTKVYTTKSSFRQHMKSHSNERPFKCEQCDREFLNAQALRVHYRIHTGERPFKCTQCNKAFTGLTNLKKHVISHTGEKPFSCPTCNKSFGLKWTLDLHMKTHSSDRPHKCEHCQRAFSCAKDLRRHNVIHTGERPHRCWKCGTAFRRKDNLDRHMRKHSDGPNDLITAPQEVDSSDVISISPQEAEHCQSVSPSTSEAPRDGHVDDLLAIFASPIAARETCGPALEHVVPAPAPEVTGGNPTPQVQDQVSTVDADNFAKRIMREFDELEALIKDEDLDVNLYDSIDMLDEFMF